MLRRVFVKVCDGIERRKQERKNGCVYTEKSKELSVCQVLERVMRQV